VLNVENRAGGFAMKTGDIIATRDIFSIQGKPGDGLGQSVSVRAMSVEEVRVATAILSFPFFSGTEIGASPVSNNHG
jgi:hypothetical protein